MAGKLINTKYFDIWSTNMAYILGFITGDGSIHYKGYRGLKALGYKLSISLHFKDKEILEFVKNEIAPNNLIHERKFGALLKSGQQRHQASLVISSRPLMDKLISIGVTPKKTGKEILPNIPTEFFGDYLRGIFDADGTISSCTYWHKASKKYYTTHYWQLVSASKTYLADIQKLLSINTNLKDHPPHCYKLDTRSKNNLPYLYNLMYSTDSFSLKRKKDKFKELLCL